MNILIAGRGHGSWTMRGLQLGAALGARVVETPTGYDYRWADVIVLVKHALTRLGADAQRTGKPVVWDALDCWRQPTQNALAPEAARAFLRAHMAATPPTLVIGATAAMAEACGGTYLPHHSRIGLQPTPARPMQTVGYDGAPPYIEAFRSDIAQHCARRGWAFVINPPDLTQVDILLALRGGPWDGWMCREWKSGVKLVNAICAGRPVITQASAAWRELQPDGSVIEGPADLGAALDHWADRDRRQAVVDRALPRAPQFDVAAVAARYRQILQRVEVPCTA